MKICEYYEKIGEDFSSVKARFYDEDMIKRFVLKFGKDETFANLSEAMRLKNVSEAFRAAHTLKGVSANLGFSALAGVSGELTEILRKGDMEGTGGLLKKIAAAYRKVVKPIKNLE